MKTDLLRGLPAVDTILRHQIVNGLMSTHPRPIVIDAVRAVLKEERSMILRSSETYQQETIEQLAAKVAARVERMGRANLRRVVNATGVILHTNLGRAPLPEAAARAILGVSSGYSNLEFDIEHGERGERYAHVEGLLRRLTGAEAAMVVNNNAAAVLLVLNSLAEGREVIVSRGELVEIGGSFRIPDVMRKSGARLIEVGTTNRTHIGDYEAAITQETALMLKVHKSNFAIKGFTSEVELDEMVEIGRTRGIPVMNDLGSGVLMDLSRFGLKREPTVIDAVKSGGDIVTFSGDKLLGGPQAGIIIGKKEIVSIVKKNPLARALRIDKLTLSSLEAVLRLYLDELQAIQEIPVLKMLGASTEALSKAAKGLCRRLRAVTSSEFEIRDVAGYSQVGGGAMPLEEIPARLVAIRRRTVSANELERRMRMNVVPIVTRIEKDEVLIDVRTLMEGDIDVIVDFIRREANAG